LYQGGGARGAVYLYESKLKENRGKGREMRPRGGRSVGHEPVDGVMAPGGRGGKKKGRRKKGGAMPGEDSQSILNFKGFDQTWREVPKVVRKKRPTKEASGKLNQDSGSRAKKPVELPP